MMDTARAMQPLTIGLVQDPRDAARLTGIWFDFDGEHFGRNGVHLLIPDDHPPEVSELFSFTPPDDDGLGRLVVLAYPGGNDHAPLERFTFEVGPANAASFGQTTMPARLLRREAVA